MPDGLTPEYWRNRAEHVRTIADDMFDPQARETLRRIARDYEQLAKQAEGRERRS